MEQPCQQTPHGTAGRADHRSPSDGSGNGAADRATCGTNPGTDHRIRRHPAGFVSTRLRPGLLCRQLARLDFLFRRFLSDRLQMGIGIEHRMRTRTGSEKQHAEHGPSSYCVHASHPLLPFSVASRASTILDVTPLIITRFTRLFAPA